MPEIPEKTLSQDEQELTERDEAKIPTDPIPPPIEEKDLPIAITVQAADAIASNLHICEFEGDPAGATGIVQIIPEHAEQTDTPSANETLTSSGVPADTDSPPPSEDGADLFEQSIFCHLKNRKIDTAVSPPASTPPLYRPSTTTDRPPDDGTLIEAAKYLLDMQRKHSG